MDIFKELTGIDLGEMQENAAKAKDKDEERSKMMAAERQRMEEEEAARRKAEEEAKLPQEEKEKLNKKKAAEAKKLEGNAAYKARKFEEAKTLYQEAIDMNPDELTFYTNKAAVYFEEKDYDGCIAESKKQSTKQKVATTITSNWQKHLLVRPMHSKVRDCLMNQSLATNQHSLKTAPLPSKML